MGRYFLRLYAEVCGCVSLGLAPLGGRIPPGDPHAPSQDPRFRRPSGGPHGFRRSPRAGRSSRESPTSASLRRFPRLRRSPSKNREAATSVRDIRKESNPGDQEIEPSQGIEPGRSGAFRKEESNPQPTDRKEETLSTRPQYKANHRNCLFADNICLFLYNERDEIPLSFSSHSSPAPRGTRAT